jgi:Protein of unknown function (DUF998)
MGQVTQVAGVIALLALAALLASLTYLHVAPTGLSPAHNAVSQYGITRFRGGYRAATIAFAIAGAALALEVATVINGHGGFQVIVLLIIFAFARAAISWFPMDAPGAERTSTGRTHGWLAIAAFGGATLAAIRLARVLDLLPSQWHALAQFSAVVGWIMAALLLVMALARSVPAVRSAFGAIERGFYLAAIVWFAIVGLGCLVIS